MKWTKSDFSLLLCTTGQNCKLDLRFSLSKNYRSFDFLSKHNISSELTMCLSYHTSMSICSESCTKLIHTRKDSYMAVNAHSFGKTICFLFLQNFFGCRLHTLVIDVLKYTSHVCWCVFACLICLVCLHASFQMCVLNLIVAFKNSTLYEDFW